jgi:hypothetical protein
MAIQRSTYSFMMNGLPSSFCIPRFSRSYVVFWSSRSTSVTAWFFSFFQGGRNFMLCRHVWCSSRSMHWAQASSTMAVKNSGLPVTGSVFLISLEKKLNESTGVLMPTTTQLSLPSRGTITSRQTRTGMNAHSSHPTKSALIPRRLLKKKEK